MARRPNYPSSHPLPIARRITFVAFAACAFALGCGEESKFEARPTPRISRTAPRRDATATAVGEFASPGEGERSNDLRSRSCAPDAILTGGEQIATDGPRMPSAATSQYDRGEMITLAELDTQTAERGADEGLPEFQVGDGWSSAGEASAEDVEALVRRAEEHNRRGLTFASKGAVFSARKEFQAALRAVAAALDASESSQEHRVSLNSGLTALTEVEDFVALESTQYDSSDIAAVIAGHVSHAVAIAEGAELTPAALRERYRNVAVERLAFAVASPTGSVALHRLGKATLFRARPNSDETRATARVFLEAALRVDENNFPAANDLAVHFAEDGYYDRAVTLLRDGLNRSSQPALWTNLAAIHELRGEAALAHAARLEARSLTSRGSSGVLPTHNVAWVDARTFAAASQPNSEMQKPANGAMNSPAPSTGADPTRAGITTRLDAAPRNSAGRQPISTALTPRRSAMVQ